MHAKKKTGLYGKWDDKRTAAFLLRRIFQHFSYIIVNIPVKFMMRSEKIQIKEGGTMAPFKFLNIVIQEELVGMRP